MPARPPEAAPPGNPSPLWPWLPPATRGLLLVLLFLLLLAGGAAACPLCKEAVQNNPKLTEGFARSIHLLMSMPYLLFGGLTLYIVRSARRKKG